MQGVFRTVVGTLKLDNHYLQLLTLSSLKLKVDPWSPAQVQPCFLVECLLPPTPASSSLVLTSQLAVRQKALISLREASWSFHGWPRCQADMEVETAGSENLWVLHKISDLLLKRHTIPSLGCHSPSPILKRLSGVTESLKLTLEWIFKMV